MKPDRGNFNNWRKIHLHPDLLKSLPEDTKPNLGFYLQGNFERHPEFGTTHTNTGHTSLVVKMDETKRICETLNSIYHLGEPYGTEEKAPV